MFAEEMNGMALLARVDDVDMNLEATTNLFTGPTGFDFVVKDVIVKPAASGFTTLAASADLDFGKVGALDDWADGYDPSGLTDTTTFLRVPPDAPTQPVKYAAGEIFAMTNNDDSAAGSLVDVFVLGQLMVA